MHFHYVFLLFLPAGALSQRALGCRMPNGSLNPSERICLDAGGGFLTASRACCTGGAGNSPVLTEARFIKGCNDNGGSVGPNEIVFPSC
ncbi:Phage tail fiber repeat 2 [Fusarium oxysporum f. sp. albedinis]|uniref:Secreted in xylem 14 n=1 Tax=Fusarium oxysporum f. sp. sesami TaxID=654397 RepID=A0A6G6A8N8_FUSOX|nr:Phage tail fiber repeat 2 [Fusarium oxysporum f. sp. albedinis]QID05180.1 secreted in xylem 14 [Fusarium oxysporum f. sp. sesami]